MATRKNPKEGYSKQELFKQAMLATADKDCVFMLDVIAMLPCSVQTFYDHFPKNSYELDALKEQINKNKVERKKDLRKHWRNPEASAGLQIALYKLLADSNELNRLNGCASPDDNAMKDEIIMRPKRLAETNED